MGAHPEAMGSTEAWLNGHVPSRAGESRVVQFLAGAVTKARVQAPIPGGPDPCPNDQPPPELPPFDAIRDPDKGEPCIKTASEWNSRIDKCDKYWPNPCDAFLNFPEEDAWSALTINDNLGDNDPDTHSLGVGAGVVESRNGVGDITYSDSPDVGFSNDQWRGVQCGWSVAMMMGSHIRNWALCMAFDDEDVDQDESICLHDALYDKRLTGGPSLGFFGGGKESYPIVITPYDSTQPVDEGLEVVANTDPKGSRGGEIRIDHDSPWATTMGDAMAADIECVEDEHLCACIETSTVLMHEILHWCSSTKHRKAGFLGLGGEPCDDLTQFMNLVRWLGFHGLPEGPGSPRTCCPEFGSTDLLNSKRSVGLETRCGQVAGCTDVGTPTDPARFLNGPAGNEVATPGLNPSWWGGGLPSQVDE